MFPSSPLAYVPESAWLGITSLGSAGLMLPVATVISVQLVLARQWRIALWWSLSIAASVALVLVTKVAFFGWGIGIRSLDFAGISGHTMLATAVLPVFTSLLFRASQNRLSTFGIVLSVILSFAVGVSRWVLGLHSPAEIVAGFLLGASVSAVFIYMTGQMKQPIMRLWVVAVLLILAIGFHFSRANLPSANDFVIRIALYASGGSTPISRAEWQHEDNVLKKYE